MFTVKQLSKLAGITPRTLHHYEIGLLKPSCVCDNGYNDDPRFKAKFDNMHTQLTEFMREAVKVHVGNNKK